MMVRQRKSTTASLPESQRGGFAGAPLDANAVGPTGWVHMARAKIPTKKAVRRLESAGAPAYGARPRRGGLGATTRALPGATLGGPHVAQKHLVDAPRRTFEGDVVAVRAGLRVVR